MDKRLFVAEENCKRLDVFLSEQTDEVSRSRLKKLIEEGQVCVNGVVVTKAGESIKVGDSVSLTIPEVVEYSVQPENIPIEIVYQDKDFAVVNKPQGMTVHVGNGTTSGTLVNALVCCVRVSCIESTRIRRGFWSLQKTTRRTCLWQVKLRKKPAIEPITPFSKGT